MAVTQLNITVGTLDAFGVPSAPLVKPVGDPVGTLPSTTTVDTDVSTLVADGASPTQGHVNTLNTDWSAFKTALSTYQTGVLEADVTVSFDTSAVTTRRQFVAALKAVIKAVEGGYGGLSA